MRRAFSLIEVMTVMACLGIGLSLGAVALVAAMRSNQIAAGTLLQIRLRAEAADVFRADVAAADSLPETDGPNSRSPTCLILQKPNEERVLYEWRESKLTRTVRNATGETQTILALPQTVSAVEFHSPNAPSAAVSLILVDSPPNGIERRIQITAALGGDRR